MWSDNETLADCIDFDHLIGAITDIVEKPDLLPCSIGIFGDWGGGKSSLMGMIEQKHAGAEDILVIRFNGWLFEGYEDTKTVLLERIVDAIISKRKFSEKALHLGAKLLRKIDFLKLAGSIAKYGAGMVVGGPVGLAAVSLHDLAGRLKETDYEKFIKEKQEQKDPDDKLRTDIQEFHANFGELLQETNLKKVLVFIDDLDRCSPDTIIGTLEAIKLFLFSKGTAFIIGADERLIRYAVRRRFPEIPGDSSEVGRDYLEKLIQFPIRIPPLNTVELTNYVNLLFTQLHTKPEEFESSRQRILADKKKKGFDFVFDINNVSDYFKQVPGELKELFQLSAQVVPILAVGLNGNPRQTKRFLNTLLIRHNMANSRGAVLDKRILAKMMLLEYFKPETFNSFYKQQAENNGQIQHIGDLERMAQDQQAVGGSPGATISPEMEAYLSDRWLKAWLQAPPTLQNIDLRPYYYVSRDKLAVKDLRLQRMSPDAQDFYSKLMSDSDAVSAPALQDAHRLNSGDAAAVFDAVCMKARETGRQVGEKAPLRRLYQFCEKRPDLISQWIGFLDKFPESDITPSAVIWLNTLTRGNAYRPAAKALVTKWAGNPVDSPLTKISKNKLSDFN